MKITKAILAVAALIFSFSSGAVAQEQNRTTVSIIGEYKDWSAYSFLENGKTVCFIASQPINSEGEYTNRDRIFWLLAHRPALKSANVSSFVAGYDLKKGSTVKVTIDNQPIKTMYPHDDRSWFPDRDDEPVMKMMRAGNRMVVEAISSRDTKTTDTFSLSGFTAAHREITKTCGM